MHPIGMVALGRLMGAAREAKLRELMDEDFRTLRVDQSQEDVAYVFNKYHLTSAPVVDADGRLVGVITIDDAMEALEEEAEEDIRRLAGVGDEELSDGVFEIARGRFVVAGGEPRGGDPRGDGDRAVHRHDPGVRGAGGADADRRLDGRQRRDAGADGDGAGDRDAQPRVGERAAVRAARGAGRASATALAFAAAIGLIAGLFFQDVRLGAVIAAAMIGNLVVAGFAGALIPIGLEKLGVDPALASGTFVTTTTDVFGFFAFLGLASADAGLTAPRWVGDPAVALPKVYGNLLGPEPGWKGAGKWPYTC